MEDPVFEYKILDALHQGRGELTQRSISEQVGRSVASVNFALRLLAAKGFLKISGANPRRLSYRITARGIIHKSALAYNFLKRQHFLYEQVRKDLMEKLEGVVRRGAKRVAIYGWTPFTETAILCLVLDGVKVAAIYVKEVGEFAQWNRIPVKLIDEFDSDCECILLMEPLPSQFSEKVGELGVRCYPNT